METLKVFKYECATLQQLSQVVQQLLLDAGTQRIFAFSGEMGAGKTTIIKEICKQLGVNDHTSSPTFTIVNEYLTKNGTVIYHFDFYRIKNIAEVFDLGFETYLYSGNYCFMEWPEKIQNLLPPEIATIVIETVNGKRNLTMRL